MQAALGHGAGPDAGRSKLGTLYKLPNAPQIIGGSRPQWPEGRHIGASDGINHELDFNRSASALLPRLWMMQFGMMASAMGVMALGYALYQAWKQTDGEGMVLDLTGPFRVGQGPIPAR